MQAKLSAVAALHHGATDQTTWLEDPPPWLCSTYCVVSIIVWTEKKTLPCLTALFALFWQWNNQRQHFPSAVYTTCKDLFFLFTYLIILISNSLPISTMSLNGCVFPVTNAVNLLQYQILNRIYIVFKLSSSTLCRKDRTTVTQCPRPVSVIRDYI